MKAACVDTHALAWFLSKPKRLGKAAAKLLRAADAGRARIWVPAIVPVELELLRDSGRNVVGAVQIEALLAAQPSFSLAPLTMHDALAFAALSSVRDPFDRMVMASARALGVPLLTADAVIAASALVETIWE